MLYYKHINDIIDSDGEPMARVPKVARWSNCNGTQKLIL